MVKVKGKVFPVHDMKSRRETRGKLHLFLTLALDWGEWLYHVPAALL
jgi:hypothetical protein